MWRAPLLCLCLAAGPAIAQQDDRDYLTAFLEDTLSDAGRTVTVTGFTGALSSRATIESLTIADDLGVWITLNDVVLDWSRSSLLSGDLVVNELTAAEILLDRMPVAGDAGLPAPEAAGFSLPDLPVSIDIARLAADRIALGPDVLGEAVTGSLESAVSLANGEGRASLDLRRTDSGPTGQVSLSASYANATQALDLSLSATEAADGITARLLGIPGAPSASLRLEGQGTLDDFAADIRLATDDQDRLTGTIAILAEAPAGRRLAADVTGNLAPILAPEMVGFFGTDVGLTLSALRSDSGRIVVDRFDLTARALTVSGAASIATDGLPEFIDLSGRLASPDGAPVLLPFTDDLRIDQGDFALRTTGDRDGWSGSVSIAGLDHQALKAELLTLDGSGRIGRSSAGRSFGGTLNLAASGLAPTDPDLAMALGSNLSGKLRLHYLDGMQSLKLSDIAVTANGLEASGALEIAGLDKAFLTSGTLRLAGEDFSRFSGLADRPVKGSGTIAISGSASRLSGFFDTEIGFVGTGLGLGIAELDRLMADQTTLDLSLRRDEGGTTLRSFVLRAGQLSASASGKVSSEGSSLSGTVDLDDLSALGPGYAGSLSLQGGFDGTPQTGKLQLDGTGQSLRTGNTELDKLLAGQSRILLRFAVDDGTLQIDDGRFETPQLRAAVTGRIRGDTRDLTLDARLANLALLAPGFTGPLSVKGTATQDASGYRLDLAGSGPGQANAKVGGRLSNDFASASLSIRGTGRAELANLLISPRAASGPVSYDLTLNGPLTLSSLGGRVTLSGGRITDPDLGLSLDAVEAIADIRSGSLRLSATSGVSSGGRLRIDGPVGLSAPYPASLAITLDALRLYDPELYETRVGGSLSLEGPLTGGARLAGSLQLGDTEIRVPASGFSASDARLDIAHRYEPPDVRTTRRRAQLIADGSKRSNAGAGAAPIALDLTISAPSRIFIRGRGIDAELGGALRLSGTTANVIPSGGFSLIRGRMDILGKRLTLSRADMTLEGRLVPEIAISASTDSGDVRTFVNVEGPADDPRVSFTSVPDLPQEEVLARLLFGRGLENLSAFQAAQLASAVATLAGRGGEGLISRLRRGTGLDDLDVTMAEDGSTSLRAGKYISENAYTEVEVGQDGKSRINLNLNLREGVTVKGKVGADGETGIGIFVERDY
jgi:translocation and assembly module TamB